jgi:cytochrome b561
MKQVTRYHPLLVALHWLLAFLIIAALLAGFFLLARMSNSDPQKIRVLLVHMAAGMTILALMVVRFIVRMLTSRPAPATTGHPFLDRIAPVTHYGFYVLVLLMVGTGYATAILAGLNRIVFQGSGEPLPENFAVYPTFIAPTAISRSSSPALLSCTCWRRSIISSCAGTDCSDGCGSAGARQRLWLRRSSSTLLATSLWRIGAASARSASNEERHAGSRQ